MRKLSEDQSQASDSADAEVGGFAPYRGRDTDGNDEDDRVRMQVRGAAIRRASTRVQFVAFLPVLRRAH